MRLTRQNIATQTFKLPPCFTTSSAVFYIKATKWIWLLVKIGYTPRTLHAELENGADWETKSIRWERWVRSQLLRAVNMFIPTVWTLAKGKGDYIFFHLGSLISNITWIWVTQFLLHRKEAICMRESSKNSFKILLCARIFFCLFVLFCLGFCVCVCFWVFGGRFYLSCAYKFYF